MFAVVDKTTERVAFATADRIAVSGGAREISGINRPQADFDIWSRAQLNKAGIHSVVPDPVPEFTPSLPRT